MATKSKVAQQSRSPKKRTEKPVTRIEEAAARAGVGEVPTIPRMNWPDTPDEHGETMAARSARLDAERRMLMCTVPGSLGSKVRQLLGQGAWVDPDAPDPKNSNCMGGSLDRAMSRVAAIQLRALAMALGGAVHCESDLDRELELSNDEAALALASIAVMLDVGWELADDLRLAQDQAVAS
jgi:hypothetical protein